MGRNNLDYKLKDKKLTKNKKAAKLNKSIAFALAGISSISIGSTLTEIPKEVRAKSSSEPPHNNKLKKLSNPKISNNSKNTSKKFSSQNYKFK